MNQPTMNNEQLALYIAAMSSNANTYDVMSKADRYYEWLESKKPKQAEIKHYLNGVELPEGYWDQLK